MKTPFLANIIDFGRITLKPGFRIGSKGVLVMEVRRLSSTLTMGPGKGRPLFIALHPTDPIDGNVTLFISWGRQREFALTHKQWMQFRRESDPKPRSWLKP